MFPKISLQHCQEQMIRAIIGRYNSYYLVEYVGQTWVTQAYVGLVNKWSNCIVIYTVGFFCSIYEQKGADGELHPGVEATWVNVLRSKHKAIPHFFLNYHRLHCRLLYLCKDFSDPHIYLSIYQTLRTKYKIHTTNAVDCRIRLNDALVENKVPKVALLFPTHTYFFCMQVSSYLLAESVYYDLEIWKGSGTQRNLNFITDMQVSSFWASDTAGGPRLELNPSLNHRCILVKSVALGTLFAYSILWWWYPFLRVLEVCQNHKT